MSRAAGGRRKELHGSSARTVQVRRVNPTFRTRVSCTGRAREKQSAWVFNTGRVREACNFHLPHTGQQHGPCPLVSIARVPSTGRVREVCRTYLPHTGRAEQHGPCSYFGLHGSRLVCTGRARDFYTARGAFLNSARGVQIGTGHAGSARVDRCFARVVQFSFF